MNLVYLALSFISFIHGIRDVLHYYGKKNFFTRFLHFYDNRKGEIPSAIVSFSLSGLLLWVSVV
jgi:hypothetical protein